MDILKIKIQQTEIKELTEKKAPKLYKTIEGKIFGVGLLLTLLLVISIVYYGVAEPTKSKIMLFVFLAHTFGGRAAGVGLCIIDGLSFCQTLIYNFFIEVQLLCVTYSIFILAITNYIKIGWVIRIATQMRENADKHKRKIAKYGWIGVFLFVVAPFPGSGPVGGSILGYLLKMSVWRNFSAVLSGTFFALIIWILCFDFLKQHLYIIQYIIGVVIIFVVLSNFKIIKSWFVKN